MIYIESPSTDPHFNLALEQYVFDELDKSHEYFMLWQNHNAIIIGKHQNTIAEINQEYVNKNNISVVRRLSGGGAVYHDLGNLNFTFIVDDGNDIGNFDFGKFCIPIVKALKNFGVNAEINGRNDMTIDDKKFSGNSQYAKKGRVMHHGTIMYDSDLSVVSSSLNVSKDKIESKGIKSVKSRITNVKEYMEKNIPLEEFKKLLLEYMFEDGSISEYKLTDKDFEAINKIKSDRYDKWDWNYGESPKYNVLKERRFDGCGKIELYLEINEGLIGKIDIHGDYFGNGDINDIKKALINCKIEENQLRKSLESLNISDYFNNMSIDNFISLLTE